ncbi:hypothetical protein [Ichthyenterobacterium magnum]|uniref:Uncharacterized protein n=1 Tax=Ichthyenterobacterium magnum TaxID=1230530 RepID=A0A420DEM2_9FLAO|nr:hypothetical protein [Ichthyenterobacterium magnum]RKE90855.1 hypothetical protein BXY80_2698 [Ichthyenterobacterium magnum]
MKALLKIAFQVIILACITTNSYSQEHNFKRCNSFIILNDYNRCEELYKNMAYTQLNNIKLHQNYRLTSWEFSNFKFKNLNSTNTTRQKVYALNKLDFKTLVKYLNHKKIDFQETKNSTNDFKQIHLQTYAGNWIVINNHKK